MDPRTARMLEARRQAAPPARRTLLNRAAAFVAWLSAHWVRATIAFSLACVMVAIGYYTLVTLPAVRRDRLAARQAAERQRDLEQQLANQTGLDQCLDQTTLDYEAEWAKACKGLKLKAGCRLPSVASEAQDVRHRDARNACFKQYLTQ